MSGIGYPQEFKDRVCARIEAGESRLQVAVSEGIAHSTIGLWLFERKTKKAGYADLRQKYVKDTPPAPQNKQSVVLVIPDMHHPFCHPDALEFLRAVKTRFLPNKFVCLGDEVDAYGFSKYPKDADCMSAGQEMQRAIENLIPFYLEFPDMMVCVSNHTIRPHKRMKEAGMLDAWLPKYNTMLNAPDGWKWAEHWIINNTRYMHGDQGKGGKYGWVVNTEIYHQSVVVGHWHSKAGVVYDSQMFNMNAGCLIDRTQKVFDYAWASHKEPNLGCGLVFNGRSAHFIPMIVDEHNRWIGRL